MEMLFRFSGWSSVILLPLILLFGDHFSVPRIGLTTDTHSLFVLALAINIPLSFMLSRIFAYRSTLSLVPGMGSFHSEFKPPRVAWLIWFQIIFSTFILLHSVYGIFSAPLNFDEQNSAYGLLTRQWHQLNPIHSDAHPLSTLASLLSLKLFGYSKAALNLPAVLFTIFFLIVLNLFCVQYVSTLGTVLVFLHLSVNQLFLWFSHSLRGYILMMALTLLALMWIADFAQDRFSNKKVIALVALFAGGIFVHPFFAIFELTLLVSLVIWMSWHLGQLSKSQVIYGCRFIVGSFLSLPFVLAILKVHHGRLVLASALDTDYPGLVHASSLSVHFLAPVAARFFGYHSENLLPLLICISLSFVMVRLIRRNKSRFGIRSVLVITYGILFVSLLAASGCKFLAPRLFLGMLPLVVICLADSVEYLLPGWEKFTAAACLVVALVIFPLVSGKDVREEITDGNRSYDQFMQEVRRQLKGNPLACVSFSGESQKSYLAANLYLTNLPAAVPKYHCTSRFHVSVPDPFVAPEHLPNANIDIAHPLYQADHNHLYQLKTERPLHLSKR